jgi:hypothetical protein
MSDVLFLEQAGGFAAVKSQPYESEDLLQKLVAQWPALLAPPGAGASGLMLVAREMPVPGSLDSGGRWALDHLFLSCEGVPVLVETKRSADPRLRREVVAQMMDYAANGAAHWTVDALRTALARRCLEEGRTMAEEEAAFMGSGVEAFWQRVKANLLSGNIRLLFVADRIAPELARIIEFLNQQMDPAEVLGLELQQFCNESARIIYPRWVGRTEAASVRKSMSGRAEAWDADEVLERADQDLGASARLVLTDLLAWANSRGLRIWGASSVRPSLLFGHVNATGALLQVMVQPQTLSATVNLETLQKGGADAAELDALRAQLAVLGGAMPSAPLYPSVPLLPACTVEPGRSQWLQLLEALVHCAARCFEAGPV